MQRSGAASRRRSSPIRGFEEGPGRWVGGEPSQVGYQPVLAHTKSRSHEGKKSGSAKTPGAFVCDIRVIQGHQQHWVGSPVAVSVAMNMNLATCRLSELPITSHEDAMYSRCGAHTGLWDGYGGGLPGPCSPGFNMPGLQPAGRVSTSPLSSRSSGAGLTGRRRGGPSGVCLTTTGLPCKGNMLKPGLEAREEERPKNSPEGPVRAKRVHRIPSPSGPTQSSRSSSLQF